MQISAIQNISLRKSKCVNGQMTDEVRIIIPVFWGYSLNEGENAVPPQDGQKSQSFMGLRPNLVRDETTRYEDYSLMQEIVEFQPCKEHKSM